MKKIAQFVLVSFFLFSSILFADTNFTVDIPGSDTYIFYNSGNNSYGSGTQCLKLGKNGSLYRSYITWDNIANYIPSGSQITGVEMYINFSNTNSQIELRDFTYNSNISTCFGNIAALSPWHTYSSSNTPFSIPELITPVQDIVDGTQNGPIRLGLTNLDEINSSNYTSYTYDVSLHVTYNGTLVSVDQVDELGSSFGTVGQYINNSWLYRNVPFTLSLPSNSSLILKSEQDFKPNTHQKYRTWTQNDIPQCINYNNFTTVNVDDNFESSFNPAYEGVIIKNLIEGSSNTAGFVEFKDPWLIDLNGHNQGVSAPFKSRNSPFVPDYITSYNGDIHKGVFFDQGYSDPSLPFYSVQSSTQSVFLTQTGQYHNLYFQNWSYDPNKFTVQYPNNYQTPVIFHSTDNAILSVNLKGTHLADNSNAIAKNNQQKAIYISDYNKHYMVYSSLGKIWCEYSTNNGISWNLVNNSAIGYGTNPSISANGLIACESGLEISIYSINNISCEYIGTIGDEYYGTKEEPVICTSENGLIFLLYKSSDGLRYFIGAIQGAGNNELVWFTEDEYVPNTSSNSLNATFTYSPGSNTVFHVAWEQNSQIKYYTITLDYDLNPLFSNYRTVSNNCGFTSNNKPSITGMAPDQARLTWVGHRTTYQEDDETGDAIAYEESKAVFCDPFNIYQSWSFGNNVHTVDINRSPEKYVIAWGRSNSEPIQCTDNTTLSVITTFPTLIGQDVQVSNGSDFTKMKMFSFTNSTQPYYFKDAAIYSDIPEEEGKINSYSFSNSREGIVIKDSAQFYFAIGDVKLNETEVKFANIPDTVSLTTISELNSYLISEPFDINDNSVLKYGVLYGITDSLAALSSLNGDDFISFRVDIIDAVTDQIINSFDNVRYEHNNVFHYNNIFYEINTEGLGNRRIKIRLIVNSNTESSYSLRNNYSTDEQFSKLNVRRINGFSANKIAKEYELEQNYPNPFNPSTTIKYQIPKDGLVTVKVYDILGREIVSLVNEFKNSGKYEVVFDASNLASGVYFYRLISKDFSTIRKMTLLR